MFFSLTESQIGVNIYLGENKRCVNDNVLLPLT